MGGDGGEEGEFAECVWGCVMFVAFDGGVLLVIE